MSKQMLELADWLLYMQRGHEASMRTNDPAVRGHIENLKAWETALRCSADSAEEKMPVARPVAFRVPRVVNDRLSKTEFRLFDDEDEARRAACDIGADYDGLFLVSDRRAAFFAQPRPSTEPQTAPDLDQIALEAARKIEALNWNNPTQRTARIQCAVTEALRRSRCQAESAPQLPAGYQKLPDGTRCKCPKMWQDGKGGYWCCLVSLSRPLLSPTDKANGGQS